MSENGKQLRGVMMLDDAHKRSTARVAAVAMCNLFGYTPELVRSITMRQMYVEFELYVLDERGGKQVRDGKPVTTFERLVFV